MAPRPRQAPVASPWLRAFGWLCVAGILLGVTAQLAHNLAVLIIWKPAMARIVTVEDLSGAPGLVLRFTTKDGREVTAALAALPFDTLSRSAGPQVSVRYDPRDPALRVTSRTAGLILMNTVANLVFWWLVLGWSVRVRQGASPNAWKTFWPPWPIKR